MARLSAPALINFEYFFPPAIRKEPAVISGTLNRYFEFQKGPTPTLILCLHLYDTRALERAIMLFVLMFYYILVE